MCFIEVRKTLCQHNILKKIWTGYGLYDCASSSVTSIMRHVNKNMAILYSIVLAIYRTAYTARMAC